MIDIQSLIKIELTLPRTVEDLAALATGDTIQVKGGNDHYSHLLTKGEQRDYLLRSELSSKPSSGRMEVYELDAGSINFIQDGVVYIHGITPRICMPDDGHHATNKSILEGANRW